MARLGLIAGEHPMLFRRCVAALQERLRVDGVVADIRVAEAHVPDVRAALAQNDTDQVRRAVVAAAAGLRTQGVDVLAMPSWRLQEFADDIEAGGPAPCLRLDRWLGRQLASEGWTRCAFLAHSEATMRPVVRYRMYTEFEVDLVGTGEDAFEAVDAWSQDWTEDPVPPRQRQLVLDWIRTAWRRHQLERVVAERRELAGIARGPLGYRQVVDLEQFWVDGLYRHVMGLPDPEPRAPVAVYILGEQMEAARAEVCRLLGCAPDEVGFVTGRGEEPEIVPPRIPGTEVLPDWVGGFRVLKP